MSLLNDASLVMIPSGYKDGTLYSAKPTNGDGDFTFSRGSNLAATRVNSEGLIEKGRENLALSSNDISTQSTYWVANQGGTTLQNSAVAPDGNTTASTITANGTNTYSGVAQSGIVMGALRYTYSVYLKAQSGTPDIRLTSFDGVTFHQQDFSITTEWERYSITFTPTAGTHNIYITSTQAVSWYAWGAQFELGLIATDIITTTTTTAQAGILEDMPRLDYSGGASCPSLLLEPQRSNVITQSEYISQLSNARSVFTINDAVSPEGVQNATKWQMNNTTGSHYVRVGFSTSDTYTFSVFAKKGNYRYLGIRSASTLIAFDFDTETFVGGSGTKEQLNNGWWRLSLTATGSGFSYFGCHFADASGGEKVTADGTEYYHLYGMQLEQASYPTSYIPTYGSSVTRSADSLTSETLSLSLGYTLLIDMETLSTSEYNQIQFRQDTPSISYILRIGNQINVGSSSYVATNTTGQNKFALGVDTDGSFAFYKNGTSVSTGSGISANLQKVRTDSSGQRIKQVTLFPTRLTNDELAELTTL